ncbi:MAG TPA: HD-GYP domain-containing protein [Actinomycetales bacterium]|nr:HD-GYP domain-containing protein [Actinomycetales bacterium]
MKESPRVVGYVLTCVLLAIASLTVALRQPPGLHLTQQVWTMAVLVTLCVVGLQLVARRLTPDVDVSVDYIVQLATLVLLGPAAAMAVGGAASLLDLRRSRAVVRIFNVALDMIAMGAAALVFAGMGGRPGFHVGDSTKNLLLDVGVPMVLANVAMLLVSCILVAGVVALDNRVPYREVLSGMLRSLTLLYIGYGLFGLLLFVLWGPAGVGPISAVLVLAPMFVARWAFAQYAEQHAAHERTVAALVSAVEAKDRYTRGHSERVARASVLIGRAVGLSQQRTSTLHFAGMLHDVGKLGVPTRVLQKSGALTDEEFLSIALHPLRGLEMVREIEFLGEALNGILHHHERIDGRGYPLGLAGDKIPEFARIIAVADAFDSMTSTRSYRQARSVNEALTELEACTDTQFDARFVLALRQALDRTEWEPVTGAPDAAPQTAADAAAAAATSDAGFGADPASEAVAGPSEGALPVDHDDPAFGVHPHSADLDDATVRVGSGERPVSDEPDARPEDGHNGRRDGVQNGRVGRGVGRGIGRGIGRRGTGRPRNGRRRP